jgi:hypothetical protein
MIAIKISKIKNEVFLVTLFTLYLKVLSKGHKKIFKLLTLTLPQIGNNFLDDLSRTHLSNFAFLNNNHYIIFIFF